MRAEFTPRITEHDHHHRQDARRPSGTDFMRFFNSRLVDLLQSALGRKKPIKKQASPRFVPWLEALEDRRLLSVTFTTIPSTQTNFDGAAITSVPTQASPSIIGHGLT